MPQRALYYPYIQIRDLNWLKGTLLVFDRVSRILPTSYDPSTEPDLKEYSWLDSKRPGLIEAADLQSLRSLEAQSKLAKRLSKDAKSKKFLERFSRGGQKSANDNTRLGFQIHQQKLSWELKEVLREFELAWDPKTREPYDHYEEYAAMHPILGQCVMATIAVACATAEDLHIVGDDRSGELHRCLADRNSEQMYDELVHGITKHDLADPQEPSSRELFEFFVRFRCDVGELDAEKLRSLRDEREAVENLLSALGKAAKSIGPMDPGGARDDAIKTEIDEILTAWKADRASMSKFWRNFFGDDLADQGTSFAENIASQAVEGVQKSNPTLIFGGGAAGLAIEQSLAASLMGSGAGLAVSLVSHTVSSALQTTRQERTSGYRFLTSLQKSGVNILSDFRAE